MYGKGAKLPSKNTMVVRFDYLDDVYKVDQYEDDENEYDEESSRVQDESILHTHTQPVDDYEDGDEEDEDGKDVLKVEKIIGQRQERREVNAMKYLSELQMKRHKVVLDRILTTREGPQILQRQKLKLLEESHQL